MQTVNDLFGERRTFKDKCAVSLEEVAPASIFSHASVSRAYSTHADDRPFGSNRRTNGSDHLGRSGLERLSAQPALFGKHPLFGCV